MVYKVLINKWSN